MLRITSVTGYFSGTPPTARSRNDSLSLARGCCRCSGCTPTACVGTRTNCRGWEERSKGTTRKAGTRGKLLTASSAARKSCDPTGGTSGPGAATCGAAVTSRSSVADLPSLASTANARFVALISPLRDETSAPASFGLTSYFYLKLCGIAPHPVGGVGTLRWHSKKSEST